MIVDMRNSIGIGSVGWRAMCTRHLGEYHEDQDERPCRCRSLPQDRRWHFRARGGVNTMKVKTNIRAGLSLKAPSPGRCLGY